MKKIIYTILFLISFPLFSNNDVTIKKEIADPVGNHSVFDYERFLNENNYSVQEGRDYLKFKGDIFSGLEVIKSQNYYVLEGDWSPVNYIESNQNNIFDFLLKKTSITKDENDNLWLSLSGPFGSWMIYKYGNYYISSWSGMGGIGPLLLINFVNGRCYFYTLEGSIWKLLPYHKGGDVYLEKVLPNS